MQKKRLVQLSADTSFNSEIRFDEKNQRWVAQKTLTEEDYFLTEDEAKAWIKKDQNGKEQAVVSPKQQPTAPKGVGGPKILPPPPGIEAKEQPKPKPSVGAGLPVGADQHKVKLPIANTKRRRLVADGKTGSCKNCEKPTENGTFCGKACQKEFYTTKK